MRSRFRWSVGPLLLFFGLALSGCLQTAQGPSDDEKEPHFLAGKSRISQMDYKGAIEAFEKALEVNPQSAAAHFELGCLFDQKEADPASAIYHYGHYLQLRPNAEKEDIVKTRILACKQELARTVSLGPVTQSLQRELDKLTDENRRLGEQAEQWKALALHLQAVTNAQVSEPVRAAVPVAPTRASSPPAASPELQPTPTRGPSLAATPGRTHAVKPGETPTVIARKYGIRLDALMAANPRLDARRMHVGQALNIPAQ
jgi:LysM repeat protein